MKFAVIAPVAAGVTARLTADCVVPDLGVLVLANHHPVVLAKRVTTVDALSRGRLRLCVGTGWLKEEIEACGTDFSSRGRRADEQLEVMRLLWDDHPDGASFHGEFFDFRPRHVLPESHRARAHPRRRAQPGGGAMPRPPTPTKPAMRRRCARHGCS
jgi:alkanesulfonate monooxygenase SsuD/methylene tetrahydromethanopterin reductase-like flavin-dependent oxidoreductase (luciferase family)